MTPAPARKARWKALGIIAGIVVSAASLLALVRVSDGDDAESPRAESGPGRSAPGAAAVASGPPADAPPAPPRAAAATTPPAAAAAGAAPPGRPPTGPDLVALRTRPAAIPTVADAAGAVAAAVAHARARDGGIAPSALARAALSQARAAAPAPSPSAPVDAGASEDGGAAQQAVLAAAARREAAGVPARDDDRGGAVRVARFAPTGGADLEGRIVDVDTGRPVTGISVEARFEGRAVEVETDAAGAFKMHGMVPGSRVLIWVGGRRDRMVAERFDVRVPDGEKKADIGMIRLLHGDELASRLDGWIGIYVARKDDLVRVSAVNAWVPASRAGIQVGDALFSVDGRDVRALGPRTVGFLLRGPIGSSTTLEVGAADGTRRKLTLERVTR